MNKNQMMLFDWSHFNMCYFGINLTDYVFYQVTHLIYDLHSHPYMHIYAYMCELKMDYRHVICCLLVI
jgi:hypothetical protein